MEQVGIIGQTEGPDDAAVRAARREADREDDQEGNEEKENGPAQPRREEPTRVSGHTLSGLDAGRDRVGWNGRVHALNTTPSSALQRMNTLSPAANRFRSPAPLATRAFQST